MQSLNILDGITTPTGVITNNSVEVLINVLLSRSTSVSYHIEYTTDGTFNTSVQTTTEKVVTATGVYEELITGLSEGIDYYYRVVANFNVSGAFISNIKNFIVTEDPYLIHFIETPKVNRRAPQANAVTVKSPTAEYTATVSGLSEDKKIERSIEIDEGDANVCQVVAEELLSRWSRELKSVSGLILLNQDLVFRKKAMINIDEAMIEDEDMVIQKLDHDIIEQTTLVICGDIILDDAELLARILDNL